MSSFSEKEQKTEVIYGINPIKAFLSREDYVLKKIIVAVGRGGSSLKEILTVARQKNIPVEWGEREALDELAGARQHQGIIGLKAAFAYAELEDLLESRNQHLSPGLIVMLDGIQDPQNLGAIIRTAHCLGANGVVIPADRAAGVTPAVLKASAGSAGRLPVARVTNLTRAVEMLKEKGFWAFGADAHEGKSIRELDFDLPVALILGCESKGIRPLIRKKCDFLVRIPMTESCDSLNVAVAAGIIQYEIIARQSKINFGRTKRED